MKSSGVSPVSSRFAATRWPAWFPFQLSVFLIVPLLSQTHILLFLFALLYAAVLRAGCTGVSVARSRR